MTWLTFIGLQEKEDRQMHGLDVGTETPRALAVHAADHFPIRTDTDAGSDQCGPGGAWVIAKVLWREDKCRSC